MEQKKRINPVIVVLSILVIALLFLCGVLWFTKGQAEKSAAEYKAAYEELLEEKEQAEKAAKDKKKQLAQYETDMKEVVNLMLDGAVVTENCANLMQSVWHNCIFRLNDSETDKYTLNSSGKFYEDFNDALDNLYRDESFIADYQAISDNQTKVTKKIRDLKNPPEEWKDAYSDLVSYYDSYYDFTELVLHTNCSLKEFKEMFEEYDNESVKRYQKMKLYLE